MQMTQSNESNWQDRIDDYLLGKLSPEESDAFEIYCFGNPEFLKEVQIREELIKVIKEKNEADLLTNSSQPITPMTNTSTKFWSNSWAWASIAAVLILTLTITLNYFKVETQPSPLAANYVENEHLESLVGQTRRSVGLEVKVTSPNINQHFNDRVYFKVDLIAGQNTVSDSLVLNILSNSNEVVYSIKLEDLDYTVKEQLEPGLYYWELIFQDDMIYFGKFFVDNAQK